MRTLQEIATIMHIEPSLATVEFWGITMPIILQLQKEGAIFFFKSDGERERNMFTIMLSGGKLQDDYFKCETDDLENGINQAINYYAEKFWF